MLSSPRNPPENRLRPDVSLRFTHHVKFSSSFWNTRARNFVSRAPAGAAILYARHAAQACTGGFTSDSPNS